ncbi:MAG: hypothetical protein ACK4S4_03765 [Pyrinomonadaceae bacterium]
MAELRDFYNDGFGWICRSCERELETENGETNDGAHRSRILREGEGERRLSTAALARWADKLRETLVCPRCGVVERIDKT